MTATPAITDTQRRFLAAVLQRLPRERVRECYLFAPMRQGGIETGIAVLAVSAEVEEPAVPDPIDAPEPDAAVAPDAAATAGIDAGAYADLGDVADDAIGDGGTGADAVLTVAPAADDDVALAPVIPADEARAAILAGEEAVEHRRDDDADAAGVEAGAARLGGDATSVAAGEVPEAGDTAPLDGAIAAAEGADPTEAAAGESAEDAGGDATDREEAGADELAAAGTSEALDLEAIANAALDEVTAPQDAAPGEAAAEPPRGGEGSGAAPRFIVYTARYRLQLKGPDRGKWEVDLREEADAPLVSVDAVVRGVQRRAGEPSEVERLTAADIASGLEAPWPPRR